MNPGEVEALCSQGFTAFLVQWVCDLQMKKNELIHNLEVIDIGNDVNNYYYNISGVPYNSRIVLYGAGYRGKRMYSMITEKDKYQIVGWIDKNAGKITEESATLPPEDISKLCYDYIVVAVDDIYLFQEIRDILLERGVSKERIIW